MRVDRDSRLPAGQHWVDLKKRHQSVTAAMPGVVKSGSGRWLALGGEVVDP